MDPPFGPLRFLYVGTGEFDRDLGYYRDTLGAPVVWNLKGFGARVAAFRVGEGPLLLIADHRPAPSVMPVYEVADLDATVEVLSGRGWRPEGPRFEIPNGPCHVFRDPSGNAYAIFQDVRPDALSGEAEEP